MKNNTLISLFILMIIFSSNSAHSGPVEPVDINGVIQDLVTVQSEVKAVGSIKADCVTCIVPIEPNQKVDLNNNEFDLGNTFSYKDNKPYIIHLKRTKSTPQKVTLKIKNPYSDCAKMFVGSSSFNPNGPLVIGCAFTYTAFEENNIDLDFKSLSLPINDEEQIIEIKFVKPKSGEFYYKIEANVVKGNSSKVKQNKKFWGYGRNLKFEDN